MNKYSHKLEIIKRYNNDNYIVLSTSKNRVTWGYRFDKYKDTFITVEFCPLPFFNEEFEYYTQNQVCLVNKIKKEDLELVFLQLTQKSLLEIL